MCEKKINFCLSQLLGGWGFRTEVVKIHNIFFLFRMNPSLRHSNAREVLDFQNFHKNISIHGTLNVIMERFIRKKKVVDSVNIGNSITVTTIKIFPKYKFIFWTLVKNQAAKKMGILLWGTWRSSGWSKCEVLVPWQEPELGELELVWKENFPVFFLKQAYKAYSRD